MSINRIQFQTGLSMPEFLEQFGTEAQCEAALEQSRWPQGFVCPCCSETGCSVFIVGAHKMFQCKACRHQTSLTAGTLFQSTKLPLATWFLAIYLVSQAKTGLSALALKRYLGVRYPTAWLIQHKLMQSMCERETKYTLSGQVQVDDAYLGGERSGGKAGRGSENKVPFVAAVSLDGNGHPLRIQLTQVTRFTLRAISSWAKANFAANCSVSSDGLACFSAVSDAVANTIPWWSVGANPKSYQNSIGSTLSWAISRPAWAVRIMPLILLNMPHVTWLVFAYRFNRRFQLDTLPMRLLVATVSIGPRPADWLRLAEVSS